VRWLFLSSKIARTRLKRGRLRESRGSGGTIMLTPLESKGTRVKLKQNVKKWGAWSRAPSALRKINRGDDTRMQTRKQPELETSAVLR